MLQRANYWLALIALLMLPAAFSGCSRHGSATSTMAAAQPLPTDDELRDRLDRVIGFSLDQRHMDQRTNAAWQVVHGILAYGPELQIYHDGKLVSAVDYLLGGGTLNGWNLRKGDHGVKAILESGSKTGMGHADQWLGYLSQCGVPLEHSLIVAGEQFTVADLLTQAQWDIYPSMEATWTLMAFCTYLPLDASWTSSDGQTWTIDRIVESEAAQDLNASPCGGSHRLYSLALALNRHLAEGGKLEGAWLKADEKLKAAAAMAKASQQPDGTFSINYFARPATTPDIALRLNTTGHTFEFLTLALNDQELTQPWMTRSLVALLDMFERTQKLDLECGGLYHAVHGLELYRLRRFGPPVDAELPSKSQPSSTGDPASAGTDSAELQPPPPPADAADASDRGEITAPAGR